MPPKLSQVYCIAFFFFCFFSSVLICGLFKGQDGPLCGGAVWNSPENAHDNGSRQPCQIGLWPALEGALLRLGVPAPIQVSLPPRPAPFGDSHREVLDLAGPRPNRSLSKGHCLESEAFQEHPTPSTHVSIQKSW